MMRSKFDEQLDRLNKEMMKMGSAIDAEHFVLV